MDVLITRIVLDKPFVFKVAVMIPALLVKLVDPTVTVRPKTRLNTVPVPLVSLECPPQSKDVSESLIPAQEPRVPRDTAVSRDFVCWDVALMGIVPKVNSVSMECA
jgi:hypothetical protein